MRPPRLTRVRVRVRDRVRVGDRVGARVRARVRVRVNVGRTEHEGLDRALRDGDEQPVVQLHGAWHTG